MTDCIVKEFSSRVCCKGTKGCIVDHGDGERLVQANEKMKQEMMEERASYEAQIARLNATIDDLREQLGLPKIIRLKAMNIESGTEKTDGS